MSPQYDECRRQVCPQCGRSLELAAPRSMCDRRPPELGSQIPFTRWHVRGITALFLLSVLCAVVLVQRPIAYPKPPSQRIVSSLNGKPLKDPVRLPPGARVRGITLYPNDEPEDWYVGFNVVGSGTVASLSQWFVRNYRNVRVRSTKRQVAAGEAHLVIRDWNNDSVTVMMCPRPGSDFARRLCLADDEQKLPYMDFIITVPKMREEIAGGTGYIIPVP